MSTAAFLQPLTCRPQYFHQHGELARDNIAPHHTFGLDTARPDNLRYIEPGKVMYAAGNTLVILEVATMKRRVIFGLDGGGVGCFAVHPSQTLIAVGGKGAAPNIYVYEYPSFKIAKVSSPYDIAPLCIKHEWKIDPWVIVIRLILCEDSVIG